jgi:hypothetical protein
MITALLMKLGVWLKKNYMVVVVLIGVLYFTGIFKNIANRIRIGGIVKSYEESPATLDYNFVAMQIHEAFDKALWFVDQPAITSLINSLSSQSEFMTLVRIYAVTYNDDLRAKLRDKFNDKQYGKLLYK